MVRVEMNENPCQLNDEQNISLSTSLHRLENSSKLHQ